MKTTIAAVMAIGCGLAAFGDTWKDSKGVTWKFATIYSDGNATALIQEATPAPKGVLTIPGSVSDGAVIYSVTAIEHDAFYQNSGITSVVVPASVETIRAAAFNQCANLKSVTFKGVPQDCNIALSFSETPFFNGVNSRYGNADMDAPAKISGVSGAAKDDNFLAWWDTATGAKSTKWYEWTAPKSGTVWFWTQGNNFNTFLGAYASGTEDDIAHNDNFAGSASQIAFPVTMGTKYAIYVGGADPNYLGEYTLKWRMGSPVTVTFDPCGGAIDVGFGGNVATYPKNVAAGALPTPTKEYYAFAGWYTKKSGGTKVTASTKFAKGTKLYAHWAKKKLRVTVTKEAGGKSVKGSGSYAWGTKVKLSATAKPGYVFRSWGSDMAGAYYEASCNAFPKFNSQCRKNLTPTVTVPKNSPLSYYASFVKKTEDTIWFKVTGGSTTLYAEDGAGGFVNLYAHSFSYPKVTTSKLPAGVKFSLLPPPTSPYSGVIYDSEYKLEIVNPDKVPAGKNVIKVTAKNRSGKTATTSIVVWGKNRTQATDNGALTVSVSTSAKTPNGIYAGMKYALSDLGMSAASGWKITKIGGLPSGITWDAKSQKLKGYTTKTGLYTFTFTVAKGKKTYTATATFKVLALPAKAVGTFYGYAAPDEFGTFFNAAARKVTVSVTSAGKVTAKIGNASFSCKGLTYDSYSGKFSASMESTSTIKKNVTYTRSLVLEFDPYADFSGNSLDGRYFEYTTKKAAHSITEVLVLQCNIVGRRNVFGYDDDGYLLFEGANLAQSALNVATVNHRISEIPFAGGSVTVTLDENANGVATLAGTIEGKSFSESAVVWYEPVNETIAYLRIYSFSLGTSITYVVTIDPSVPCADSVAPPTIPAG